MVNKQHHLKLIPLLIKYDISWDLFCKKGRLPDSLKWTKGKGAYVNTQKEIREKVWTCSSYERRAILILDGDSLDHAKGWGFLIWTEKDRLKNVKCA